MRVLVAPDKFAGTLTAVEAAQAIATGWSREAPDDELDLAPMSDGGPGFVDVLHAELGGEMLAVTVEAPHGERVPATVLFVEDVAYVESAQACGLHLIDGGAEFGSTVGVGELVAAAVESGASRVVVGLGGSGTNDGGAGLLSALGATSDGILDSGAIALDTVKTVDLTAARERLAGVELVAATDVDNPLTGMFGATKVFGPQKGIKEDRIAEVDGWLESFAAAADKRISLEKGAGAAGGLGYALLLLGATRASGLDLVADAVGLAARARAADLVLT
ncbi:MAG: glycerate kinase family protein, partial [Nocardioides sp.]